MWFRLADEKPLKFTAGVRLHAAVKFIQFAEVKGLLGKYVLVCDADPDKPVVEVENTFTLTFGGANHGHSLEGHAGFT